MSRRPHVALALSGPELRDALFSPRLRTRLHQLATCDFDAVITDFEEPPVDLSTVDVLLTGWGCPRIDSAALALLPRLGTGRPRRRYGQGPCRPSLLGPRHYR